MPSYKNPKTGTWFCKFYYTDWQGEKKQKKKEGFSTQREAKAFEQEFLQSMARDCTMSFSHLSEVYLEDISHRQKPTSLLIKRCDFRNYFLPAFGGESINAISAADVRRWQTSLMTKALRPITLHRLNTELSTFFRYAIKYYGLKINPVSVAGNIGSGKARSLNFWTQDEFGKFLAVIENPQHKMLFTLLFYSGVRIGECLALTVADFDSRRSTLDINKSLSVVEGREIVQSPKTSKSVRTVVLPSKVSRLLKDYIRKHIGNDSAQRIFGTLYKEMCRRLLKRYAARAGVKAIRVHDLRHSHASMLINLGVPPLAISERLGHESVQTTLNVYSHLYPDKAKEVAKTLNNLIPS